MKTDGVLTRSVASLLKSGSILLRTRRRKSGHDGCMILLMALDVGATMMYGNGKFRIHVTDSNVPITDAYVVAIFYDLFRKTIKLIIGK